MGKWVSSDSEASGYDDVIPPTSKGMGCNGSHIWAPRPFPGQTLLGHRIPDGGSTGLGLRVGVEPQEGGDQAAGSPPPPAAFWWGSP